MTHGTLLEPGILVRMVTPDPEHPGRTAESCATQVGARSASAWRREVLLATCWTFAVAWCARGAVAGREERGLLDAPGFPDWLPAAVAAGVGFALCVVLRGKEGVATAVALTALTIGLRAFPMAPKKPLGSARLTAMG